jgi:hypothetical protein
LLKKKQAGVPVSREQAPTRPQNTINVMDALRRSVAQGRAGSIPPRRCKRQGETGPSYPGERDKTSGPRPTSRPTVRGRHKRALLDHHKPVLMTEGPIEDRERMHDPDQCIDDVDCPNARTDGIFTVQLNYRRTSMLLHSKSSSASVGRRSSGVTAEFLSATARTTAGSTTC